MDPIGAVAAILQISRNAYAIGRYIYQIYEGSKHIDDSIRNLANEVNDLADSCGLVHDELRTVLGKQHSGATESRYDKDGRLGRCVDQQVVQCDNTLRELGRVVDTLWPRKDTLYARASKQIDLQNNRDQIDDIRKRIRSHTDALHTILLVVNIRVSHIAPDHATQQLPAKLNNLQRSLTNIESKLNGSPRRKDSVGDGDTTLVNFARDTLRSGKTLYEASVAGSVHGGADSVMGGGEAATQALEVAEWVSRVNALRRESREGQFSDIELPAASVFSDDGRDTVATRSTSGGAPRLSNLNEEDIDYDSDDEQVELAQAALDNGNRAFDAEKWDLASKYLHTSLKLLYKLPHKHKRQQDIFALQFRLAVCSYHTGDVDHAEAGLESLLQHEPLSDKEGIQLCDARHLLSRIYVEQNKLDLARVACEGTLKARSKLLGKQHIARYESMALMSRVCSLSNDDVLSDLYASRIPESYRNDLISAVATLQPSQPLHEVAAMPIISTTSDPSSISAFGPAGTQPSERPITSQYHLNSDGSLPSLSPGLPPLSVSPKTLEGDILEPGMKELHITDQTDQFRGDARRWPSTTTRSSDYSIAAPVTPDTLSTNEPTIAQLPGRPQRWQSAPMVTDIQVPETRRAASTSIRAKSILSLDVTPEETYSPLRTQPSDLSNTDSGPMSRSDRRAIVARFQIEPMHNLDQAICDGKLEKSLTLVNALLSGSTQLGNPATTIIYNSNGLKYANKSPALHLAVLFGDVELVKPLVKNGFAPNFAFKLSDEPGLRECQTPLDIAIASRNHKIIRDLLANGASLDPAKGESPCRQLIAHASLQLWPPSEVSEITSTLKLLLSFGWPISKGFARNQTPSPTPTFLHQACSITPSLHDYRLPLVQYILEQSDTATISAPASETPLHHAVRRDDLDVVNALMQGQPTYKVRSLLEKTNTQQCQPLYLAVTRAVADSDLPLDIVARLLQLGASLDDVHTQFESRRFRTSKKTQSTARSIAMESSRQDLIDLVEGFEEKQVAKPLARSRTVSDDISMHHRSAVPHIGVLR